MKIIILILTLSLSQLSFGQSDFITRCENGYDDDALSTFAMLKSLMLIQSKSGETEFSCKELQKFIASKKSFSELITPDGSGPKYRKYLNNWTDELPYMYGISTDLVFTALSSSVSMDYIDLSPLKEFKNLIHISYLPEYYYYEDGICNILKDFPQIKFVTINSADLLKPEVDKCLSASSIRGVIIRNKFSGFTSKAPKTKIVGIESYSGSFAKLSEYPDLIFLGISNESQSNAGTAPLTTMTNLTHFSMNSKGVKNIAFLERLQRITHLQLTCYDVNKENVPVACKSGAYIEDLNFVKKFLNLKSLNISFNALKDVSVLKDISALQQLKLRGNQIESLPDFSKLSSLNYLDLSGNSLKDISTVKGATHLKFLNLSGNKISDVSSLSGLDELVYLNLSNNSIKASTLEPIPSLKVLNLNGATKTNIKINLDDYFFTYASARLDETLLNTSLNDDFYSSGLKGCETKPAIAGELDFSGFENLEVLSLNNNQLRNFPDISSLTKLRYLSLERNQIRVMPDLSNSKIDYLDLSVNNLVRIEQVGENSILDVMSNDITDMSGNFNGKILAGNNLIRNLNGLNGSAELDLRGNPFEDKYCSQELLGFSNQFCPTETEYPDRNVIKPQGLDLMEWHETKKCPISE